jgi:enamine deaminase RidA (YjgF/YER057c/UK114 family)
MQDDAIEKKLRSMGLALPVLPGSKGIYKSCLQEGNMLYVSGHVSVNADGSYIKGKLGKDLTEEEGKVAARQAGLAMLTSIKNHFDTLDKVKRVIKLLGMVNAVPEFEKHPVVINGCSELFAELWGQDYGIGVRSAVGMGSLPGNVSVEIEAIFEVY